MSFGRGWGNRGGGEGGRRENDALKKKKVEGEYEDDREEREGNRWCRRGKHAPPPLNDAADAAQPAECTSDAASAAAHHRSARCALS